MTNSLEHDNLIYRRQLMVMIFFLTITYKIVMLPKYLAMGVSHDYVIGIMVALAIDMVMYGLVYYTITYGEVSHMYSHIWVKRMIMALICISCILKFSVLIVETLDYISSLLFQEGRWLFIILTIMPALSYIAYKGANIIARMAEIIIWAVVVAFLFTLLFMRADVDITNILPLFDSDLTSTTDTMMRHSMWFGDFTPLLVVKLMPKRSMLDRVAMPTGVIGTYSLTIGFYVLFQAIYGDVSPYIKYAFSNIGIYNSLSYLLGGVDFPIVCVWMLMAMVKLSFLLYAIRYTLEEIFTRGDRRHARSIISIIVSLVYMLVLSFAVSGTRIMYDFATSNVRYLVMAIDYTLPIILAVTRCMRNRTKSINKHTYMYVSDVRGGEYG